MFQTAYNATDNALVVTDDGHNIGAHSFGSADVDFSADLAAAGDLHLFPEGIADGPGQNSEAVEAHKKTLELNGAKADKVNAEATAKEAAEAKKGANQ